MIIDQGSILHNNWFKAFYSILSKGTKTELHMYLEPAPFFVFTAGGHKEMSSALAEQ
jgi:hypothetical protein